MTATPWMFRDSTWWMPAMSPVLADDHLGQQSLGQQSRPRQPFVDGLGRLAGENDLLLAVLAGVLRRHMLHDEQRGRLIVELLADFFTDGLSSLAAARAKPLSRWHVMDDAPAGRTCLP
jgi:hypothetical protein